MRTFHRTQNDSERNRPARQGARATPCWEQPLQPGSLGCSSLSLRLAAHRRMGRATTPLVKAAKMRGMQPCLPRVFTLRNWETGYHYHLFIWLCQVLFAADGIFELHCDTLEHQSLLQPAGYLVAAFKLSVVG